MQANPKKVPESLEDFSEAEKCMYDRLLREESEAFRQGKMFRPPELPTRDEFSRFRRYRWIKVEKPAHEEVDRYMEQYAREKAEKLAREQGR